MFAIYTKILFPILLGIIASQLKWFTQEEGNAIRKFVIQICVPFLVAENILRANISLIQQIGGQILSLILFSFLSTLFIYAVTLPLQKKSSLRNTIALGSFTGNYGYLGWGIIESLFGKDGLTLAVFFNLLFWPVFLSSGFLLVWLLQKNEIQTQKIPFLKILTQRALPLLSIALISLFIRLLEVPLPPVLFQITSQYSPMVIPLILFAIGLDLEISKHLPKLILHSLPAVFLRLILSSVVGLLTLKIIGLFYPMQTLAKQVVFMESVMPTAVMSVFFTDYLPCEKKLLSSIITTTTLLSLATIPFWYKIATEVLF